MARKIKKLTTKEIHKAAAYFAAIGGGKVNDINRQPGLLRIAVSEYGKAKRFQPGNKLSL